MFHRNPEVRGEGAKGEEERERGEEEREKGTEEEVAAVTVRGMAEERTAEESSRIRSHR